MVCSRKQQTLPPAPPPGELDKNIRRLWFDLFPPLSENMTSSTKPEVHNVLHCRQWRTEPTERWPSHGHISNMYRKLGQIWTCGFEMPSDRQADKHTYIQTDKHTDTLITILHTPSNRGQCDRSNIVGAYNKSTISAQKVYNVQIFTTGSIKSTINQTSWVWSVIRWSWTLVASLSVVAGDTCGAAGAHAVSTGRVRCNASAHGVFLSRRSNAVWL